MNFKRFIDQNMKLVGYGVLIIVMFFLATKSLDFYYKKESERKREEILNGKNNTTQNTQNTTETENINYSVENYSIKSTMDAFVSFCNNREIGKAYQMLTDECKNAMFPTEYYLSTTYIDKIYNVKKSYDMIKWSEDGNKTTFLVKLYENLLSTGGSHENYTEDYYTFIKNSNGVYKINISNYIFGEERNIEITKNGVTVKIEYADIYEEYEELKIKFTNNTSKTICLNGDRDSRKIYLYNSRGTVYSSINSEFDKEELIMKPKAKKTISVKFNKVYSSSNKITGMWINDVILDYEAYLNSTSKKSYSNRMTIDVKY